MEEQNFEKQGTKSLGLIFAIIAIVVLVGGLIFLNLAKSPKKIFAKAVENIFEFDDSADSMKMELDFSAEIESNEPEVSMMNQMIKAANIKLSSEIDLDKEICNYDIDVTYDGKDVVGAEALIQDNSIYFYLNEIFDKYIEVDEEALEGMEVSISEIFNKENTEKSEEILKAVEKGVLEGLKDAEYEKEKVELNGKKVQKSTLKLNEKKTLKIALEALKQLEKENIEGLENIDEVIDTLEEKIKDHEETGTIFEISLYTKGLMSKVVKAEISVAHKDEEFIIALVGEKKSDEETTVKVLANIESTKLKDATEILNISIVEEDKNKGTMEIKIEMENIMSIVSELGITDADEFEGLAVILKVGYSIDYDAKISEKDVSRSVPFDEITEEDLAKMQENIEDNPFLSGIAEELLGDMSYDDDYDYDYDDDYDYDFDTEYSDPILDSAQDTLE